MHKARITSLNLFWAATITLCCSSAGYGAPVMDLRESDGPVPNVLLILVDDLGYSDIEPYGSEIPTPRLSALAQQGTVFTNVHSGMKCNPTRAMLLTGLDNNMAATGTRKTYHLSPDVPTLPERLRNLGYHTIMAGKWDLGTAPAQEPGARGFDNSVALLPGVSTHFPNAFGNDVLPDGSSVGYRRNGQPMRLPEDFYSTSFYTRELLRAISTRPAEKPFFAYLALTAPHYPLQAPANDIQRFDGWYADGYQATRSERLAKQRELGIFSDGANPWEELQLPQWQSLSAERRAYEAKRMQVYAAMVSLMDRAVGEILDYLDETQLAANTLVIFASDNGPDGTQRGAGFSDEYNNETANLGNADSFVTQGFDWAQVSATPWRLVKSYPTEGGTRVPFIARLPGVVPQDSRSSEFLRLMDLMPTLLALGGDEGAFTIERQAKLDPAFLGRDARATLTGKSSPYHHDDPIIHTYVERRLGGASVQQGPWKAVWWKEKQQYLAPMLFQLSEDPAETQDLAKENPAQLALLLSHWRRYQQIIGDSIVEAQPEAR